MGIVDRVKHKYLARLDELIAAGTKMPMEQHSARTSTNMHGESTYRHYQLANGAHFGEWRTSCVAVLDQIVSPLSLLRTTVEGIRSVSSEPSKIEFVVGFLRAVRKELEAGSLDSLARQIEAEVLSDYLDQAAATLAGEQREPSHIAAAVIAGASLERSLRALCASLSPPEPVVAPSGQNFGMSALIDALKRRQVYNEVRAKELRSWAAVRNSAAHGDFAAFNRQQVENMVSGISSFIVEFIR